MHAEFGGDVVGEGGGVFTRTFYCKSKGKGVGFLHHLKFENSKNIG